MNVHEYQAKGLLARYGVTVPEGGVAATPEEAERVAEGIDAGYWVVKAQIHAGDRGQSGGVKIARSTTEVGHLARTLLGRSLVTQQTGPAGMFVRRVYVERGCDVGRELYLSLLVDWETARLTAVASPRGGAAVEHVAGAAPESIVKVALPTRGAVSGADAEAVSEALALQGEQAQALHALLDALHRAYLELDASLIEINPLVVTAAGDLVAVDVKMSFDDNALFRHSELEAMRDEDEDPDRMERERHGFNYVRLGGDVGCLVTGAGLALATMDLLRLHGGEPANFLDLPPVATRLEVAAALRRILSQPGVRSVLVNAVGGGLTDCGTVAEGIITAGRESGIRVPLVVRFGGTSRDHAVVLLKNAGVRFVLAEDMASAARQAIAAAGEAG